MAKKNRLKEWTTRDGRRIPVKDMTTAHVANSIGMIRRRKNWRQQWLPVLEAELRIRRQEKLQEYRWLQGYKADLDPELMRDAMFEPRES